MWLVAREVMATAPKGGRAPSAEGGLSPVPSCDYGEAREGARSDMASGPNSQERRGAHMWSFSCCREEATPVVSGAAAARRGWLVLLYLMLRPS
jgi:hypothetical protein